MQELQLNRCERCFGQAKIFLPYGPHRFCAEHFNSFFEKRVQATIRQNKLIKYGEKVAVGVSGGKDSMATLHLLHRLYGKTAQNKIEAIMIDEGIKGYRDRALQIGAKHCEENGIDYHVVKYQDELGLDMNEVMKKIHEDPQLGSTCSFCGVFRRDFLNEKALEIGADKLATGHNLDDECQSIAMSLFGSDFARASRLGPTTGERRFEKMVPRIKPLYETPEKDIIAYTAINGIEHSSEECCPYSWMAKRNHYRKMLNELENAVPGTKLSMLASFMKMKPLLADFEKENGKGLGECTRCGSPSRGEVCGTCRQMEKLLEMPSPQGREGIGVEKGPVQELKKHGAMTCSQTKRM